MYKHTHREGYSSKPTAVTSAESQAAARFAISMAVLCNQYKIRRLKYDDASNPTSFTATNEGKADDGQGYKYIRDAFSLIVLLQPSGSSSWGREGSLYNISRMIPDLKVRLESYDNWATLMLQSLKSIDRVGGVGAGFRFLA